jgi:hypothetical protein
VIFFQIILANHAKTTALLDAPEELTAISALTLSVKNVTFSIQVAVNVYPTLERIQAIPYVSATKDYTGT